MGEQEAAPPPVNDELTFHLSGFEYGQVMQQLEFLGWQVLGGHYNQDMSRKLYKKLAAQCGYTIVDPPPPPPPAPPPAPQGPPQQGKKVGGAAFMARSISVGRQLVACSPHAGFAQKSGEGLP